MLETIHNVDPAFIVPLYIDSPDRLENAYIFIDYMRRIGFSDINITEIGSHQQFFTQHCNYNFIKRSEFVRTELINDMVKSITNNTISIIDIDILLSRDQIIRSCELISNNIADMIIPYNGRYLELSRELLPYIKNIKDIKLLSNFGTDRFDVEFYIGVGGCLFFNRRSFINGGMMNEYFKNWGCEDEEIYNRFFRLGYNVVHLKECGPIHHIQHHRSSNDCPESEEYKNNFALMSKLKNMDMCELKNYIKNNFTWMIK